MHSKLDILPMIKRFLVFVQTQFSTHIQIIRIDNAMDFFQQERTAILNSLDIIHQSSYPCTPQQMASWNVNIGTS